MPDQNESLDVSAKTVEEAIEQGLSQLGLSREQVEIEVVHEGKRGLFGLGAEEALVRLIPRQPAQPGSDGPTEKVAPHPADVAEPKQAADTFDDDDDDEDTVVIVPEPAPTAPAKTQLPPVEEIGAEYLSNLLKRMGVQATVTTRIATDLVEPGDEPPLVFDVQGNDLGILIGRRNETLQALQYMVRLMISKDLGSWQPVVVDVESYRARRRESLRKMAQRMAERAVANRERVVLEAMPAYERRIIHIALRNHPAVITKSIGRDKNRKVTIIPKKNN